MCVNFGKMTNREINLKNHLKSKPHKIKNAFYVEKDKVLQNKLHA